MRLVTMLFAVIAFISIGFSSTACSSAETIHNHLYYHLATHPEGDAITGEWNVVFSLADTTTPATFSFNLEGKKVTGTAYSAHTGAGTVTEGTWDDGKLSFKLEFAKHESIAVTGVLQGEKLVGEFLTEGMQGSWEATRK